MDWADSVCRECAASYLHAIISNNNVYGSWRIYSCNSGHRWMECLSHEYRVRLLEDNEDPAAKDWPHLPECICRPENWRFLKVLAARKEVRKHRNALERAQKRLKVARKIHRKHKDSLVPIQTAPLKKKS